MTAKTQKPPKRPYHKPQLKRVRLNAEEAVLTACKTPIFNGTLWGSNVCDSWLYECRDQGS